MTQPSLDRSFGFLLHDIARLLRKRYEQRARPLGLTRAQWQVLAHLQRHEGINQSGLADLLELEPITIARLVDRMEEAGLVDRRADPADRRALGDEVRGEAFAGFDPAEREGLIDMLLRVRGNLSEKRDDESALAAAR